MTLDEAKKILKENNINSKNADYLYKYLNDLNKFEEGINKLINGIPVQYIVGNVDFYGNLFNVNSNVLIPRFETEELVSKTIDYIKKYFNDNVKIIDLGTGSGCIAITLKKFLPNSKIDAVDISLEALSIANENAKLNNADINFFKHDMRTPLKQKYDVIISNPPYIRHDEEIMEIVKNNEPHLALYANNNGLEFYEKILKNSKENLNEKSIIAFEIGEKQGKDIIAMAKKNYPNSIIKLEKDLQNKDRFIFVFNKIEQYKGKVYE